MKICFSRFDDFRSKSSAILLLTKETLDFTANRTSELIKCKNSRLPKSTLESTITMPNLTK